MAEQAEKETIELEASKKIIKLEVGTGNDKKTFEVPEHIVRMSKTIANLIDSIPEDEENDDDPDANVIPVQLVTSSVFKRVLEFCELHQHDAPMSAEERKEWKTKGIDERDLEFVATGDKDITPLYEMAMAANVLDIQLLLDTTCKALAQFIKTKTPEEIKQFMGIEGEFTEAEIAEAKREHEWLKDVTLPKPNVTATETK